MLEQADIADLFSFKGKIEAQEVKIKPNYYTFGVTCPLLVSPVQRFLNHWSLNDSEQLCELF